MIYGDRNTGVIVQGATGKQGAFHISLMNEYAKQVGGRGVVAGVTPGKGGQEIHGVPVYMQHAILLWKRHMQVLNL